jgi:hypothetical protein
LLAERTAGRKPGIADAKSGTHFSWETPWRFRLAGESSRFVLVASPNQKSGVHFSRETL